MLYSEIKHFRGNFSACRALRLALDFLVDQAPGLPDGKHDLPDGMFIQIRHYEPAPAAGRRYETHVRMADIQAVLEGEEILYSQPLPEGALPTEDHLADRDLRFYDQLSDRNGYPLILRPGVFSLLLPADAHKPECFSGVGKCRKAIIKIPVELLEP
ncbi:MAG: YhcH/YjgK/YiaL family protein [Planctomycetota bacterium]|jgi:biofilm protein TabA|nr:YhcH/YjgK/YiaL family protein [Planctomycetota bacterium]